MGDHFQTVVDRDVALGDAERSAADVVRWLVERGIIEPGRTDCVLGDTGYPPGPNYLLAVETSPLYDDHTLNLRTNGLEVVIGRTVFHAGQFGLTLVCRACGSGVDGGEAWSAAVGEWFKEQGDGNFACPTCGHAEPVTEWAYDPPWGFGNLGFQFWNWLPLKPAFFAEVSQRLGRRTVLVAGKI